jgi:beta-glucosidase
MTNHRFPDDFTWGVATASYQIEGSVEADGRQPSIWDTFSNTPGKVNNGDTGAVACDHYHRYADDVTLIKHQLGVDAYRFSIAWPRILPEGTGRINQAGLDFYSRLVDALLEAGITPYATLYHWDLPQALEDAGGWPVRATADAYVRYADVVCKALGDRVKHWMTFNEPWVFTYLGYGIGYHAPGRADWGDYLKAVHHFLIAHAGAVPAIRAHCPDATVGLVVNPTWADPVSSSEADQAAAQRQMDFQNRWFLDPIYKGAYPEDLAARYAKHGFMPDIHDGDMTMIQGAPDFLGVNFYTREVVRHADDANLLELESIPQSGDHTAMGWEVYPQGIYNVLTWLHNTYAPAQIMITENGAAFDDTLSDDGAVHDPRRQAFYAQYLAQVHRAIQDGVPVSGYFAWSLMDNFEWAEGYDKRFGLVYVDYETQERIVKDSGQWYAQTIANNGFDL